MKTAKRSLAFFLALVMAFSVLTVGSSAEDGQTEVKAGRFILSDSRLCAIDLSDQIQDLSTVNTGMLDLQFDGGTNRMDARFDPENPGVVRFGWIKENGVFIESSIWLSGINYTFVLTAKEGNLFDDVPGFGFTVKDVFDSVDDMRIDLPRPSLAVGEMDGDLVKTLTISYKPDWPECGFLLDTVDLDKEIQLTVSLLGNSVAFRAVPVRYENGDLTVALYDGDKAGVALHEIEMTLNGMDMMYDKIRFNFYRIGFVIPEGLFSYGDSGVVNAEQILIDPTIEGLPVRDYLGIHIPVWGLVLLERLEPDGKLFGILSGILQFLEYPFAVFVIVRAARQLRKSFDAYGMDSRAIFREWARYFWKEMFQSMFDSLFDAS